MTSTVGGQFPDAEIVLEIFAHVRDPGHPSCPKLAPSSPFLPLLGGGMCTAGDVGDMVAPIVEEAARQEGLIVHTLVEAPVLEALQELAGKFQVLPQEVALVGTFIY
jgi:hypothetical protein